MKKLSFLFAALVISVMTFATNYVKTDLANIKSTDVVLIVATTSEGTYAMSNDNGTSSLPTAVSVTVSDTYIIETEATNILWNITYDATASTFTVNVAGGTNKLYCTNSNTGVRVGTNDANVFNITDNYIYNIAQKRYLGVYDKSNWRCYTSINTNIQNQTFAFYVKEVAPVPATGIALDQNALSLDKGATAQLTATLTPADATTEVVWTTDNDAVATVANGLVTAVGVGSATITATVTPAEGTTYTATCAVTVAAAPDAPTFTVADEVFEGSMNVSIAAAEDMKIYYTTNGDEPTAASTEYTAPFEITATTTVKAIAYDEANAKASVVATKTYTKAMTCAEANAAAANTVINLNTVTVVYVNGSYIYVADATGTTLVYKEEFGLKAGQIVKGIKGTIKIHSGLPEIVPTVALTDLTVSEGGLQPMPTVLTTVPTAALVNQYVKFEGVKFDKDYANYSTKDNANIVVGESNLVVRNNFTIDFGDIKKDYAYDITGFVCVYNSTVQLYPVTINDITMHGAYTIGTTDCDYASLAEAVKTFDVKMANGLVTDDVEFLIASNLTESVNTGIINTTDYTLTIRPDKDEDRVITYTTAADNAGPSGNFVIGGDMRETNIPFVTTATKNVVIDGAASGQDTRRLSIVGTTTGGRAVVVYGKAENIVIKNCIIKHTRTSGTTYALEVRTEKETDNAPQNLVVENCYLEVLGTANAQTVVFNGSQKKTADGVPTNTTLRDCEFATNARGIFFNGAKDVTIEGCTFRLAKASTGLLTHAIMGNAQTGIINVKGNKFIENKTTNTYAGEYGLRSITASGGATVWMIENNYFAGYDILNTTDKDFTLTAIRCGDSCVVRHNTFYMPKLTNIPGTAAMSANPVTLIYLAGSKKYIVQNNIFVCNEDVANVSIIRGSLTENTIGNKFYCVEGNGVIVAGAAMCADFAALTTNYPTQAATSKWVNVNFADAANGNLDLTGTSDGDVNLGVDALEGVTTDIYGTVRAAYTYAGAYEGTALTKPVDPSTGIPAIEAADGVQKIVRNGQVLILRDGKTYNMMGQVVE